MSTKTSVGTTVMRVLEDKNLPGSIRTGVTKALIKEGDLVNYMLEELVGGIGLRAQRMYDYAKAGTYTFGLPSGQFTTGVDGLDQVSAALQSIEGGPVVIKYSHYGHPNNLHIGWLRLVDTYGYNPATNQIGTLTASKGTPVYLDDMVVMVPSEQFSKLEPSTLALWGIAANAGYTPTRTGGTPASQALMKPTPVVLQVAGSSEFLRVTYGWMVGTVYTKASFDIPVTGYDMNAEFFHVYYTVAGVLKYWMYRDGQGTFPLLDAVYDRTPEPSGSFFPFAYFRYQKHSENSNKTTPAYLTSKKLVSYLGMNYDQVADGINANPNIADVEQAIMMMAVPANTIDPLERRYLWEFFNNLFLASAPGTQFSSQTAAEIQSQYQTYNGFALRTTILTPGIVIQDTRFKMSLENEGVYKRRVAGSVGAVGTYSSAFEVMHRAVEVDTFSGGMDGTWSKTTVDMPTKSHFYRRQVSKSFYDEIQVVEMRTRFYIIDGYTTIGNETSELLLVPLDHSITRHYSVPDRETIFARSLHYVFNSVVYTHVAWYQSGWFQILLIIVAVVIFIYTGVDTYTPIFAAFAGGNYAAALIMIGTLVLETIAIQYAFKLFVKAVGVEAALVIAIVAVAIGVGLSLNAGSIAGAPWASELLQLSSGISKSIGSQLKDDYLNLMNEASEFSIFVKDQTKLLDDAKALLESSNKLDPFVIFGESPQDFYNRTVHSGNIGVVGINAVSVYVDTALTLPKLRDTLGD